MVNIHKVIDWNVPDIPTSPDHKELVRLLRDIGSEADFEYRSVRDVEFFFDDMARRYDLLLQRIEIDEDCKRSAVHAVEDLLRFIPNHLVLKLGTRQMEIEAWLGKQNIDCELINIGDICIIAFVCKDDLILTKLYMGEEVLT